MHPLLTHIVRTTLLIFHHVLRFRFDIVIMNILKVDSDAHRQLVDVHCT